MKLEIEIKHNIGDKVYYVSHDYKLQLGEVTAIYICKDNKIKYLLDGAHIRTENEVFLSKEECEKDLPKFSYNVFDTIYYCLNKTLYEGFITCKQIRNNMPCYDIESGGEKYYSVSENYLYPTLEEALEHF